LQPRRSFREQSNRRIGFGLGSSTRLAHQTQIVTKSPEPATNRTIQKACEKRTLTAPQGEPPRKTNYRAAMAIGAVMPVSAFTKGRCKSPPAFCTVYEKHDIALFAVSTTDPVDAGLVSNLAPPRGNLTGVSVDPGPEIWGKRFSCSERLSQQFRRWEFLRYEEARIAPQCCHFGGSRCRSMRPRLVDERT
jgi:hypothetical protein